jgi:hypothetical protein
MHLETKTTFKYPSPEPTSYKDFPWSKSPPCEIIYLRNLKLFIAATVLLILLKILYWLTSLITLYAPGFFAWCALNEFKINSH